MVRRSDGTGNADVGQDWILRCDSISQLRESQQGMMVYLYECNRQPENVKVTKNTGFALVSLMEE